MNRVGGVDGADPTPILKYRATVTSYNITINPPPKQTHARRWWGSLRVHDALRLDYKAFTAHTAQAGPLRFGMSSVLVPVEGPSVRGYLSAYLPPPNPTRPDLI